MGWIRRVGKAWSVISAVAIVTLWVTALASPAIAHGENDARPIARQVVVGDYVVSLWQVIGDHGSGLSAHVIVNFGSNAPDPSTLVTLAVGESSPVVFEATPSPAIDGAWQTLGSVDFGDQVRVGVDTGADMAWSESIIVPSPASDSLPMGPIITAAALFTIAVVVWLGRRFRRAWTRPHQTQTAHVYP